MKIEMIATDLDGTLLGGTEGRYGCFPAGLAALRHAASQNIQITIVSGRDFEFIVQLLEREGIRYIEEGWPNFIVAEERFLYRLCDGRFEPDTVWNESIESVERSQFDKIRAGVNDLLTNEIAIVDNKASRQDRELEERRGFIEVSFTDSVKAQLAEPILSAWLQHNKLPYVSIRNVADVCIRHESIGKGTMLGKICREINISPIQVLAVGDSANDMSMLDGRFGFIGSAPGNSEAQVKAAIRSNHGYIATETYGNGVAEVINQYLNKL